MSLRAFGTIDLGAMAVGHIKLDNKLLYSANTANYGFALFIVNTTGQRCSTTSQEPFIYQVHYEICGDGYTVSRGTPLYHTFFKVHYVVNPRREGNQ